MHRTAHCTGISLLTLLLLLNDNISLFIKGWSTTVVTNTKFIAN